MIRTLYRTGALLLLAAAGQSGANTELDAAFEKDVLIIAANQFACYRFDIYLALEYDQQRRGLMHVRSLPERTGMLFVYADDDFHSMWMKNTFIPLDIAFAFADGRIANIALNTEPQSLKSISSVAPVSYVLELNAGVTAKLHIGEGARILWGPIFEL